MTTARKNRIETTYRVGDDVLLTFGTSQVLARVIEDRGFIGVRGRQLVRIRVEPMTQDEEPLEFEMPAEELKPAPETQQPGSVLESKQSKRPTR